MVPSCTVGYTRRHGRCTAEHRIYDVPRATRSKHEVPYIEAYGGMMPGSDSAVT